MLGSFPLMQAHGVFDYAHSVSAIVKPTRDFVNFVKRIGTNSDSDIAHRSQRFASGNGILVIAEISMEMPRSKNLRPQRWSGNVLVP